jgi:hypothetical protein
MPLLEPVSEHFASANGEKRTATTSKAIRQKCLKEYFHAVVKSFLTKPKASGTYHSYSRSSGQGHDPEDEA